MLRFLLGSLLFLSSVVSAGVIPLKDVKDTPQNAGIINQDMQWLDREKVNQGDANPTSGYIKIGNALICWGKFYNTSQNCNSGVIFNTPIQNLPIPFIGFYYVFTQFQYDYSTWNAFTTPKGLTSSTFVIQVNPQYTGTGCGVSWYAIGSWK